MSRRITALLVIVLALCLALPAQAQTTQRPLSDFLNEQGQTGGDNPPSFVPPDPNFLGFSTIFPTSFSPGYPYKDRGWVKKASSIVPFAGVDYAGLAANYENGLGTNPVEMKVPEITGTVTERPLPDGKAEVTVVMHTKGANIWVIELDLEGDIGDQIANKPTVFGHRPRDVAQDAEPALADTLLHVVFLIDYPGAPLPDLVAINYNTEIEKFVAFNAHGEGPLADGTRGRCQITQTGLFGVAAKNFPNLYLSSPSRVAYDFFPVENINLQAVGK